ncbi:MAG: response regulator [Lentisphaeraceae bacterium]|nr:response regulator [Lentisphaeraceae bacterium]
MSSTILIIDDMIQTLKYLSLYLSKDGFEVRTAKSYDEGFSILEKEPINLILLDVMMPGVDGFEACKRLKKNEKYADIPIIFVTSCDSGDAIRQCFDAGGVDYVYKFATQRELLARVKTQLTLSEKQGSERRALQRFSMALNIFPQDIITVDTNGTIIFMNEGTRGLINKEKDPANISEVDEAIRPLLGLDLIDQVKKDLKILETKQTFGAVTRLTTIVPVINEMINQCEFLFIVSKDISEEEELEMHMRQSKKMESVSMIAGGAAHDLNNILGGMLGYTSMARMHCDNTLSEEFIIKAENAAEKAAAVISQLLNFAKQKDTTVENTSVKHLVKESVKLLSSTLNKKRKLNVDDIEEDFVIKVDTYLVQQAIVNILIALDKTMADTSSIRITVSSTFNRDTLLPFRDEDVFGDFVKIMIVDEEEYDQMRDNPISVDISRNKNLVAGLGVAIVCGIVKDFSGMFHIHGDTQKPTGFTVCFPLVKVEESPEDKEETKQSSAKILVVDCEVLFVQMVKDLMDLLGYEADFCDSGEECLQKYLPKADSYDVLMLDYGEKQLSPVEVMEKFSESSPNLKLLLTSSQQVEEVSMIADLQGCAFIEKPFKMKEFSEILTSLLKP